MIKRTQQKDEKKFARIKADTTRIRINVAFPYSMKKKQRKIEQRTHIQVESI